MSGGGGGSDMPFYAQQDRLFGTQASIAENMFGQYANYAPNTLYDLAKMVDDANSGNYEQRLYARMRDEAMANNASANAMERQATERQLASMGVNANDPRFAASARGTELGNAARLSSQLNTAAHDSQQRGEDMTWARTSDFYNTLAGMPTTASSSLASAGSGYASMANAQMSNDAANASGFGKYGQQAAQNVFGKKDGGIIRKRGLQGGLHMAAGGLIPVAGNKPYGLSLNTSGSGKQKKRNSTLQALGLMAAPIVSQGLAQLLAPSIKEAGNSLRDSWFGGSGDAAGLHGTGDVQPPVPVEDRSIEGVSATQDPAPVEDLSIQGDSLAPYFDEDITPSILYDSGAGLGFARGGAIKRRGLRGSGTQEYNPLAKRIARFPGGLGQKLAFGGMVGMSPRSMSGGFGLSGQAPGSMMGRSAGRAPTGGGGGQETPDTAGRQALAFGNKLAQPYIKDALSGLGNSPTAAAQGGTDLLSASGAESFPVADTMSGVTGTELAGGASGEAAGMGATEMASAGMGEAMGAAAGAEAGATAGTAGGPVGTIVGAAIGALLSSMLADGGEVKPTQALKAVRGLAGPRQRRVSAMNPRRKDVTDGGEIEGPGTETSDDVPVMASDGEYMLNAEAVRLLGVDTCDRINQMGLEMREKREREKRGKRMARGGQVRGLKR